MLLPKLNKPNKNTEILNVPSYKYHIANYYEMIILKKSEQLIKRIFSLIEKYEYLIKV